MNPAVVLKRAPSQKLSADTSAKSRDLRPLREFLQLRSAAGNEPLIVRYAAVTCWHRSSGLQRHDAVHQLGVTILLSNGETLPLPTLSYEMVTQAMRHRYGDQFEDLFVSADDGAAYTRVEHVWAWSLAPGSSGNTVHAIGGHTLPGAYEARAWLSKQLCDLWSEPQAAEPAVRRVHKDEQVTPFEPGDKVEAGKLYSFDGSVYRRTRPNDRWPSKSPSDESEAWVLQP